MAINSIALPNTDKNCAALIFNFCSESDVFVCCHLPPLSNVHRLNNPWDFIYKGNGACNVVEHRNISDLLPRHGHILKQFEHCMGHIFQCPADKKATNTVTNEHV